MKRLYNISRALLVAGLICGAGAYAKADVIDLSGFNLGSMGNGNSYTVGAFTLTATINPSNHPTDVATIYSDGGTNVVGDGDTGDYFGTLLDITRTGGGTFTVNSIDVANIGGGGGSAGCGSGFRLEVSTDVGGCFVYAPTTSALTTETLNIAGVSDLTLNFVSLGSNFVATNFNLTPDAPEPSTMALAGLGLLLAAGGFARRRN